MLSLHKKAQNGGLTAQEVFWLENQQNDHPYFGMVYMILARHHYRNQSTIRNRALLKGAAFANNRSLLRNYLEGTLVAPKQKPVPVRDMKPILEQKELEAAAKAKKAEKKELEAQAPAPIVETAATPIVVQNQSPVEGKISLEKEETIAPEVIAEVETTPEAVIATNADLASEKTSEKAAPVKKEGEGETVAEATAETPAQIQLGSTDSEINWFLNMRLKLRMDKYSGTGKRLADQISSFVPAATQKVTQTTKAAPAPEAAPSKEDKSPATPKNTGQDKPNGNSVKPATKAEAPDKNYAIGEYSSFSFIAGDATEVAENEIDKGFSNIESIEFQSNDGNSEIIMEENGRVVEISVSPEALNKYFKGKLPVEAQSFSIGEFHIELDEEEYHALEEQKEEAISPSPQPVLEEKKAVETLIEKFIENEPGITRGGADYSKMGDLSKNSNRDDEEWVTETLAKIYEMQGNSSKALKIYQKLRLRFPDKNDYFAGLIDNLKR